MPPPKARGDSRDRTEQMEEADDKEKATNAIFWTRRSYCNHELTANGASVPALTRLDRTTVSHGRGGATGPILFMLNYYPLVREGSVTVFSCVATGELTRLQAIV